MHPCRKCEWGLDQFGVRAYETSMRETTGGAQQLPLVSSEGESAGAGAGKNSALITRGVPEELRLVPFHDRARAPLTRRVLSGASIHDQLSRRIVVHELRDVRPERRAYCDPHVHDFAEVNLLLSLTGLRYVRTCSKVAVFSSRCSKPFSTRP